MPVRVAALMFTVVLLSACGQKGPLYIPEDDQSPEPAAEDS